MLKRKLMLLIALLAVFGMVAASCGSDDEPTAEEPAGEPAAGGEGSIWVLLPDSATSDRWEKDDRRFFTEGFEAAGLVDGTDFTIVNAEGDAATQISQAEQAIGDGASVIVLTSNDSGSGATIIDLAREADVAVVEYDRFNTEGSGGDVYVSFDNVRVGATMADVLEPAIDGLGVDVPQVVMLNGGEEDNNAFLFRDGYNQVVEARVGAGDWALVADQFVPGWDNAEALSIFDQILVGAGNDVNAVFAANDGIAGSVIAGLENAGLDPTTIPVSGQDATQAGIQNVLLGKQAMSVYKPIKAEAAAAVQAALALRAGEDVTSLTGDFSIIGINADGTPADGPTGDGVVPYIALVPIAVTADNVGDTVVADGFRTLDELCTPEVAAVAAALCGGSGEEASGGEGSIWVLLPDSATSDRWEKDDRRFFTEGFEAAGLVDGTDFTIVNAEGDAATQISQAEQAIGDGASVIVLTSNDSGSGATIIDLAREADVAVVEYDRFNTEGSGGDVYVSFDNVRVGATMADVLEPAIDGLGVDVPQVVMLNGGEEDNNAFLFRDGYNQVVEARVGAGDWALVADQFVPGWDNAEALSIFDQILVGAGNDVNAVFAANDGIAGSVIAGLENAGLDPTTIPVSGQDATQAGIQNVLLGKQAMSVYKPIKAEAAVAVQAALALRAGEDVTSITGDFSIIGINADGTPADGPTGDGVVPYIALVPIAVTADNVGDTVVADGFRTLDELCTPEVTEAAPELCG